MKLLFVLIFAFFHLPHNNQDKIIWDEDQKLTWKDFKGMPIRSAGFVASTNTGINFGYTFSIDKDDIKVKYSVESFFNPEKSWFIPGQVSQNVLNHEQVHFDISELHARMLRKRLELRKFTVKVKSEIETIYVQVESQRKAMQKKFDAETDHSRNYKKQKSWEKQITKQLAEYESWK